MFNFRLSAERGYTLIELILILFCISLLLSLSFPVWTALHDELQFRSLLRQIDLALDHCQMSARTLGLHCSLTVDNREAKMTFKFRDSGMIIEETEKKLQLVGAKVKTNFPNQTIHFNAKGRISRAGSIEIAWRDKEARLSLSLGSGEKRWQR